MSVSRYAYRQRGHGNLFPADAQQNLPEEQFSHGLRRIAAVEASKGSFGEAVEAVLRAFTAAPQVEVGKRQLEDLVRRAAADFDAFYAQPERPAVPAEAVLALSFDGKGIVMRPEALRPGTAAAAARATKKLATRLSKGEKANRKLMAEVAAVFDVAPVPRTPEDILAPSEDKQRPAPHATGKWVTASVALDMDTVIAQGSPRRSGATRSTAAPGWPSLTATTTNSGTCENMPAPVTWNSSPSWTSSMCWSISGEPLGASIRKETPRLRPGSGRKATASHLTPQQRKPADACADYLHRKRAYLDYPTALERGWPIATGVIEGTCRNLVKDRMDITGARWGLDSAEAVLQLRALRSNGDFDRYWPFHLTQEQHRVHASRYLGELIPRPH